jgi:hypothetical protein
MDHPQQRARADSRVWCNVKYRRYGHTTRKHPARTRRSFTPEWSCTADWHVAARPFSPLAPQAFYRAAELKSAAYARCQEHQSTLQAEDGRTAAGWRSCFNCARSPPLYNNPSSQPSGLLSFECTKAHGFLSRSSLAYRIENWLTALFLRAALEARIEGESFPFGLRTAQHSTAQHIQDLGFLVLYY